MNGGRESSEEEITGLLIATLFAGQHTSSITTSWTGLRMVADKANSYAKAQQEQRELMKKVRGRGHETRQEQRKITLRGCAVADAITSNICSVVCTHPFLCWPPAMLFCALAHMHRSSHCK